MVKFKNSEEYVRERIIIAQKLKEILPKIEEDNRLAPAVEAIRSAIAASPRIPEPEREEIVQEQANTATDTNATVGDQRAALSGIKEWLRLTDQKIEREDMSDNDNEFLRQMELKITNEILPLLENSEDPVLLSLAKNVLAKIVPRNEEAAKLIARKLPRGNPGGDKGKGGGSGSGCGLYADFDDSNVTRSLRISGTLNSNPEIPPKDLPLPFIPDSGEARALAMFPRVQQIYENRMRQTFSLPSVTPPERETPQIKTLPELPSYEGGDSGGGQGGVRSIEQEARGTGSTDKQLTNSPAAMAGAGQVTGEPLTRGGAGRQQATEQPREPKIQISTPKEKIAEEIPHNTDMKLKEIFVGKLPKEFTFDKNKCIETLVKNNWETIFFIQRLNQETGKNRERILEWMKMVIKEELQKSIWREYRVLVTGKGLLNETNLSLVRNLLGQMPREIFSGQFLGLILGSSGMLLVSSLGIISFLPGTSFTLGEFLKLFMKFIPPEKLPLKSPSNDRAGVGDYVFYLNYIFVILIFLILKEKLKEYDYGLVYGILKERIKKEKKMLKILIRAPENQGSRAPVKQTRGQR